MGEVHWSRDGLEDLYGLWDYFLADAVAWNYRNAFSLIHRWDVSIKKGFYHRGHGEHRDIRLRSDFWAFVIIE